MIINKKRIQNSPKLGKSIQNCSLVVSKVYNEAMLVEIIRLMLRQKKYPVSEIAYDKMLQIVTFCHKHYERSRIYEHLERLYYIDEQNNDEDDPDVTLESIFRKAVELVSS